MRNCDGNLPLGRGVLVAAAPCAADRAATPTAEPGTITAAMSVPGKPPPDLDPEDDDTGRGGFNPGPYMLAGLIAWIMLAWLLL